MHLYHKRLVATLCLSLGITCFLFGTFSKAQHLTNRRIRGLIIPPVAFDAIPRGVPITALPSCFSFSCRWHIVSVVESACLVSNFQMVTVVATCLALFPLLLKPCVRYAGRFSCFGWICWTCRGADRAGAHELVLSGLPCTKSKVLHNFLFFAPPPLCATFYAIPRSVPFPSFPSRSSNLSSRH